MSGLSERRAGAVVRVSGRQIRSISSGRVPRVDAVGERRVFLFSMIAA